MTLHSDADASQLLLMVRLEHDDDAADALVLADGHPIVPVVPKMTASLMAAISSAVASRSVTYWPSRCL